MGSGAVTVSQTTAQHRFLGFAGGGIDDGDAAAGAGVLGTFDFDRDVQTNGSLAGLGNVIAFGDATGASGFSGAAFGSSSAGGVNGDGDVFTATADSEAEAGLSGSVRTRNALNLRGTDSNFVGSLGTTIGGQDTGISFSRLDVFSDNAIGLAPLELGSVEDAKRSFFGEESLAQVVDANGDPVLIAVLDASGNPVLDAGGNPVLQPVFQPIFTNPVNGVGFTVTSDLGDDINLAISSAGGGLQSLDVDTGGFFTGGAAGFGENSFGFAEAAAD